MSETMTMVNISKRIFKEGEFVNGKLIIVDLDKISKLPEVANNLRVENCIFVTNPKIVAEYKYKNFLVFFKMVLLRKPYCVI